MITNLTGLLSLLEFQLGGGEELLPLQKMSQMRMKLVNKSADFLSICDFNIFIIYLNTGIHINNINMHHL